MMGIPSLPIELMINPCGGNEIAGIEVEGALVSGSFINWAFALKEGKNGGKKLGRAHLLIFLNGVTKLKPIIFFFLPAATLFLCKDDCP